MAETFRIRTLSPWRIDFRVGDAHFSPDIPTDEADALLCNWGPSEELFTFPRRKAWYCCEPSIQFNSIDGGTWPELRKRLAPSEFLWHNHPDLEFRVPHVTHFEELTVAEEPDRHPRAIAIVSNFGGTPRRRTSAIQLRNRLATTANVDLYGRESWSKYRQSIFSLRARKPKNYRGPIPGDWNDTEKRNLVKRFVACVCMENSQEENYFTEKFVEAVTAGCVPIYMAHETLADTVLDGAAWIDPSSFDNNPRKTVEAALECDSRKIVTQNKLWLSSNRELSTTHHHQVFRRIASILAESNT